MSLEITWFHFEIFLPGEREPAREALIGRTVDDAREQAKRIYPDARYIIHVDTVRKERQVDTPRGDTADARATFEHGEAGRAARQRPGPRAAGSKQRSQQARQREHERQRQQEQRHPVKKRVAIDPYKVLGVPREATKKEIRTAYLKLVKQYHPDRVNDLGDELKELALNKTHQINAAYKMIG